MLSRDWFGLAVRLIGVWQFVIAARHGFGLIDLILRLNLNRPEPLYGYELGNTFDYVFYVLVHVILGVSLIFGADFLTACAYPGSRTGHVNQFDEQVPNSPANDEPN
ncbi:MAG TPA: hypothetical protein PKD54_16260 [Pirellulaceae bacterium]|mgnify:CR=1 FL=1|nr:hypothetical protein [Pirellulaceae bacterium]